MKNIILKIKSKGLKGIFLALKNRIFCLDDRLWQTFVFKRLKTNSNWILFQSEGDFSDNARALFEYMQKEHGSKYKYIWLVKYPKKYPKYANTYFISTEAKFILGRKLMLYYTYRSKYLFFTHPGWYTDKKPEQIIINLWHGCGYKGSKGLIEFDNLFDYALVTGPLYKDIQANFFNCSATKMLTIGLPRNDLLFAESNLAKEFVAHLTNKTEHCKIIIWMPTFRKSINHELSEETLSHETGLPIFEDSKSLNVMDNYLREKNIKLILKIHHLQDNAAININKYSNIIMISDHDLTRRNIQLYEILGYTHALITDYSSIAIDYLLIDRPIAFTLDDYDNYRKSRGFILEDPLKIMPGNKIYNRNDFYKFIDSIYEEDDSYKIERGLVNKQVNVESTCYSRDLLDYLGI